VMGLGERLGYRATRVAGRWPDQQMVLCQTHYIGVSVPPSFLATLASSKSNSRSMRRRDSSVMRPKQPIDVGTLGVDHHRPEVRRGGTPPQYLSAASRRDTRIGRAMLPNTSGAKRPSLASFSRVPCATVSAQNTRFSDRTGYETQRICPIDDANSVNRPGALVTQALARNAGSIPSRVPTPAC
jgi:hypothetical protein